MKIQLYKKKRKVILTSVLLILFVVCCFGIVSLIVKKDIENAVILAALTMLFPIAWVDLYRNGFYNGKIIILDEYIVFEVPKRRIELKWDKVQYIVVGSELGRKSIGIFSEGFSNRYNINKDYFTNWRVPLSRLNKSFIYLEFRKKAIDEIKKHWKKPIINEYIAYI